MLILWSLTSHYMRKRYLCGGERLALDAGFSPPCLCRGGCHIVTIQFGMHYSSLSSSTIINIHRASRGRRLTKRNNHKYGEHLLTFLSPYES